MRILSKPLTELKPEYDLVVVGSGYGASIAASRFSRAGLRVCVLEKGKEFQPGDYPDSIVEAEKEMQINADNREAHQNGLYEFHVSESITVFKGCGLGGTSLVNANVSIQPEPRVLDDPRWPAAIKNDMQSLQDGYARAKEMLRPAPYPENKAGFPPLAKAEAQKKTAAKMNAPFRYTDINVNFDVDGMNQVGVEQHPCNNCGDCVTGCNHHAKNTLIMNYLPDAVNHGAEIFCGAEVSHVQRTDDKWLVWFRLLNADREKFHAPMLLVRASHVVLGGGALGSTEILLRSKENGLSVSDQIGNHFTGNGDVLGFAYDCDDKMNGIGLGKHFADKRFAPVGACITTIIDLRHQPVLEDGMTLEEGSIPGALASVINASLLPLAKMSGDNTKGGFTGWMRESENEASSFIRGAYHGATNHTQTYLVMTHDDGNGKMNLKNDRLNIDWPNVGKQPIFEKVNDTLHQAASTLNGTYIKDLVWSKLFNQSLITVHPLGGCCMADDAANGVTNDCGNVFSGTNGNATHSGLYVLDGSIVPRPLGTNPLFTISALAERACKIILQKISRETSYDFPSVKPTQPQLAAGVQFTETMRGFFSTSEKNDFQKGYDDGEKNQSPIMFTLTVQTQDVEAFVKDPQHTASMAGTVIAPALSTMPLTISGGIFNLFVKDPDNPKVLLMKYHMTLNSVEGKQFYFYGYKKAGDDSAFDLWRDTTVLYTTVYEGIDEKAPVLGVGILKIAMGDFGIQMETMKAVNTTSMMGSMKALEAFGMLFGKDIIDTYFKKFF